MEAWERHRLTIQENPPAGRRLEGFMITQGRRVTDPLDSWSSERAKGGPGAGSLLIATLLGIGVGLLAAPQPGVKTRKQLLKRLAALGQDLGEGLEDVQELSGKAKKRARQRLASLMEEAGEGSAEVPDFESEDREESSAFGRVLAILASLAATYFLTSERTATARHRVQDVATDVGRRATDQWDRFQRGGFRGRREQADAGENRSETRTGSPSSDEAPQAS
jgi:gas vesicle protein